MKRIFAWVGITSGVLGILVLSSFWVVNKRENVPDATGAENYVQKWGGNLPNSDAAPRINSNDAISLNQQGRLLQRLKQYEQALTYYNRAIAINPKYSPALVGECETLNQLQKYEQALTLCDRALAVDGIMDNISQAYIWHQRSNALLGLQKYEEALTSALRAISIKQDYAEAWNNKGVSLWNLGKYSEAEAATKKAIDINPKYTQGWFNHGRVLSSLQQYERAVIAYDNALSSDVNAVEQSTRASILTNKGAALWHLKNYNLALNSTNEAIQSNPNIFEAWYNKGVFLLNLQDYNQALQAYYKANSISSNNAYVWTGIGMALAGKGQQQEALTAFKKASNINPNDADIQQQRETLLSTIANGKKRLAISH